MGTGKRPGGGGGGHCLFDGRYPKQNYRPGSVLPQPSLTALAGLQIFRVSNYYCYYCCCCIVPQQAGFFSYTDTIALIKTSIMANPICFPWTRQAKNSYTTEKAPSDSPPSESTWVSDSPPFASLDRVDSHSSQGPYCSGYPKPG